MNRRAGLTSVHADYLEDLTLRLAAGIAELPEEVRARHAKYLLARQREDGGFAGREGGATCITRALRCGRWRCWASCMVRRRSGRRRFLRSRLAGQESIVDFLSLIYGAVLLESAAGIDVFAGADPNWREAVAAALEKLRRSDGGYAKGAEGVASSTYHTFLVLLCLQLIGREPQEPEQIVAFLRSQRVRGGRLSRDSGQQAGRHESDGGGDRGAADSGCTRRKHADWIRLISWPRCRPTKAACGPTREFRSPTC